MRNKQPKSEVQIIEEFLKQEGFTEITKHEKRSKEFKKSVAEFTRKKPAARAKRHR